MDACVWGGAVVDLRERGFDAAWMGDIDPQASDRDVLERAQREGRVLITLDKDFGELAIVRGQPHCGIVRLVGFRANEQVIATASVLESHAGELENGALVTASPAKVRVREPSS